MSARRSPTPEEAFWRVVRVRGTPDDVVEYELDCARFDLYEEPSWGMVDPDEPHDVWELAWKRIQDRH